MRQLLLVIATAGYLAAQTTEIRSAISGFPGKVSLYAQNLATGATYDFHGDDPVRTASTIKVPIMVECFAEAAAGQLRWDELLTLTPEAKVSGSGVLTEFSDQIKLPVRDLMHLMIVVSDNSATNLVLDRIGGDAVNRRMESLGLHQTRSLRKILNDHDPNFRASRGMSEEGRKPENQSFGIGKSTPREMVLLLAKMYRGELVSKEASAEMLAILKREQYHDGIGRTLTDVEVATKPGALDHLRSDIGIVFSKGGPIAMAITCDGIPEVAYLPDNPGNLLISRLSVLLTAELTRKRD